MIILKTKRPIFTYLAYQAILWSMLNGSRSTSWWQMLLFGNIIFHGGRNRAFLSFKYHEMHLILINMKLLCKMFWIDIVRIKKWYWYWKGTIPYDQMFPFPTRCPLSLPSTLFTMWSSHWVNAKVFYRGGLDMLATFFLIGTRYACHISQFGDQICLPRFKILKCLSPKTGSLPVKSDWRKWSAMKLRTLWSNYIWPEMHLF